MNKSTPEAIAAHYQHQQESIEKLTRLLKKRKPATESEFVELAIARSKPYPIHLARCVWRSHHE